MPSLRAFFSLAFIVTAASAGLCQDTEEAVVPKSKIVLFNGKDFTGLTTWVKGSGREDPKKVFSVKDGVIHATGEANGYVATAKPYKDYHLSVEYRWAKKTEGGKYVRNSGVLLHGTGPDGGGGGGAWMASIECQLAQGCNGDLIPISGKGIPVSFKSEIALGTDKRPRWKAGGEVRTFTKNQLWWNQHDPSFQELLDTRGKDDVESPLGEWTKVECLCRGNTIDVLINGKLVTRCFDASPSSGKILLQSEGYAIDFRNFELKPLEAK